MINLQLDFVQFFVVFLFHRVRKYIYCTMWVCTNAYFLDIRPCACVIGTDICVHRHILLVSYQFCLLFFPCGFAMPFFRGRISVRKCRNNDDDVDDETHSIYLFHSGFKLVVVRDILCTLSMCDCTHTYICNMCVSL